MKRIYLLLSIIIAIAGFGCGQPKPILAEVQSTAFKLSSERIFVFARDHFSGKAGGNYPSVVFVTNGEIEGTHVQGISGGIIASDRVVIASDTDRKHILLIAPSAGEWIEWKDEDSKFIVHKSEEPPDISNLVVLMEFQRSAR